MVEDKFFTGIVEFIPVHVRTEGGVAVGIGGEGAGGFVAVVDLSGSLGEQ